MSLCEIKREEIIEQSTAVEQLAVTVPTNTPATESSEEFFTPHEPANQPVGSGRGIHPGRVVWAHNPKATAWQALFNHFNQQRSAAERYKPGEKIAIKLNQNACTSYAYADQTPSATRYNPTFDEGYLTPASLGVHAHWNNPEAKEYARNLGAAEEIEIVKVI